MEIVIDIDEEDWKDINDIHFIREDLKFKIGKAIMKGTPLPKLLSKIKDDIGRYELDCRFADYSQTDECTICNKNVFESIYRIIDKYIEGSESE